MARHVAWTKDLERTLDSLDAKVQKKLIRKSIRAAAKVLAGEIKAKSPVGEGLLKRSVKVRSGKRKKGNISMVVMVEGGREEGFAGFVEFGRRNQPANPFVRRSIAARREDVVDEIVNGLAEAISSIS